MAVTPVPKMSATPSFPALSDRAAGTYNAKAFAFGTHLSDKFNDEVAAVAESVYNNAVEAEGKATAAGQSAFDAYNYRNTAGQFKDEAQVARNQSVAARDAAVAAAGQIGTAAAFSDANPVVKGSDDPTKQLRMDVSGLPAGVTRVVKAPRRNGQLATLEDASLLLKTERTANATLTVADQGALIEIKSGSFTQVFASPAELGDGWSCYIRNSGNGDITIPLSDDVADWKMYPGEMRLFQCNGEKLVSFVLECFYLVAATTRQFVRPPGYKLIAGRLIGAGDGGQGGGATAVEYGQGRGGASGKGGRATSFDIPVSLLPAGSAVTITVAAGTNGGAGAAAGSSALGVAGGVGGVTRFGTIVNSNADTSDYYAGGASSAGGIGTGGGSAAGENGKDANCGGGSGGAGNGGTGTQQISAPAPAGGTSQQAGNGGNGGRGGAYNRGTGTTGLPGQAPGGGGGGGGGGGSGASSGQASGAGGQGGPGARGEAWVWGIV